MLKQLIQFFQDRPEGKGRPMEIRREASDAEFITDSILLKIVLSHMVRNALEACGGSETVVLNADAREEEVEFSVQHPNFIPKDVQLQIFQRGFTTKGEGRGLGTYTMRLLSERYLKGKVSFVSTKNVGTTFRVCYPSYI